MGEPQQRQRTFVFAGIAVLLAAALAAWLLSGGETRPSGSGVAAAEPPGAAGGAGPAATATPTAVATGPTAPADGGEAAAQGADRPAIEAKWGSGPDQLGRLRQQEGNPEAPMSFAFDPAGRPLVLDQVNERIVRYDAAGKAIGSVPVTQQAPQDLAIAADGTLATLDRLADKTVALLSPDGRLLGELPVEGKGIEEGGSVTGVFVDGEDVYVEREHGDLVRVGDTQGNVDKERPEIPGRPSRDGLSYLSAGIVDAAAGRLFVNSVDKATREHRFTRELRMGVPAPAILLLDTDQRGNIYLGALLELPGAAEHAPTFLIRVTCLMPADGQPWGTVDLPPSTGPEETFRDLVVLDGGGVVAAIRSEDGVRYQRFECR